MLDQYQDVFECLSSLGVEYVVRGGVAAAANGVPRSALARVPGELLGFSLATRVDHDVDDGGDGRRQRL